VFVPAAAASSAVDNCYRQLDRHDRQPPGCTRRRCRWLRSADRLWRTDSDDRRVNMDPKAFLGRGWSYPIAPNASRVDVTLAEHAEDIRQAVLIILQTGRGERVMRPDFGAGLDDFLFEPINTTTLALLQHRVEQSLITWEPRIRVETIDVQSNASEQGRIDIRIEYSVRTTNTFYNLVYPFYIQEGGT
jgi:uncharacterized protein